MRGLFSVGFNCEEVLKMTMMMMKKKKREKEKLHEIREKEELKRDIKKEKGQNTK